MRPIRHSIARLSLLVTCVASPASAQSPNPWLAACASNPFPWSPGLTWKRKSPVSFTAQRLDRDRFWTVSKRASRAIAMLAHRPFVQLTSSQVQTFLEKNVVVSDRRHQLRPFLVRAIGAEGIRDVRWDGRVLEVTGIAMGACPEVARQPIIVFLERQPQEVFVDTWGIL